MANLLKALLKETLWIAFSFLFFLLNRIVRTMFFFRKSQLSQFVLFAISTTCERTFSLYRQQIPQHIKVLTIHPSLNGLKELFSTLGQRSVYFFVLDHWRYFRSHRMGCVLSVIAKLDRPTVTLQHAGFKEDAMLGLASVKSSLTIVRSPFERRYLSGRRIRTLDLGQVEMLQSMSDKIQTFSKPTVLIAVCTHDEYKTDAEHLAYLTGLIQALRGLNYEVQVRPHPGEMHRLSFYRAILSGFSGGVTLVSERFHPLSYCALVTRASSVAEEFFFWGVPVILADLYRNGPSNVYKINPNFRNFCYAPFDKNELNHVIQASVIAQKSLEAASKNVFRRARHAYRFLSHI
jgi:hypothetical protein